MNPFFVFLHWLDSKLINLFPRPAYDIAPQDLPINKSETPTPNNRLELLCTAIRDFEGKPGDRNYRNNNPGNCRYSSVGYLSKYEPVRRDKDGFAIFKDWATGWLYLKNLIAYKVKKNPSQTLLQFMSVYAPSTDGNNPLVYANFIAKRVGATANTPMRDLV